MTLLDGFSFAATSDPAATNFTRITGLSRPVLHEFLKQFAGTAASQSSTKTHPGTAM